LEPYDNPFWGFSNGGNNKKRKKKKKNMDNSGLRLSDTVCTATLGPRLIKAPPQRARGVSKFFWGLISPFFVRMKPL
jgi:hypothetical protein